MTEETEPKETPFDAEWEILKMRGRFSDILNMIEELRQKDRSLSARISRLKLRALEEPDVDVDVDEEPGILSRLESMPLEERAVFLADLIDRYGTPPPE